MIKPDNSWNNSLWLEFQKLLGGNIVDGDKITVGYSFGYVR